MFSYGTVLDLFSVTVSTQVLLQQQAQGESQDQGKTSEIDLNEVSEVVIKGLESKGVKDIVLLRDAFETPNGAKGLKTHGTLSIPSQTSDKLRAAQFILLQFTAQNILQQVIITAPNNDDYADQMIERILNSVEVKPKEN
ncbi:hypothetical protein N7U66_11670 [Lacinutrix neustonica]|uniref:Uncharacterized protein n=1 Tax=Lacinutrix neustonica TaxID=2980107 RepID=A0A9E8MTX5_9FLAO|nr:hypothetical protein [Lacinutrix neustonica]WAC00895.1 hypothetical protein N7U66_11670 [Lacinutrix neustonica]